MCLGFVFVAPINDSYVHYRSRMRTGTLSLYLESICSMTFHHFPFSTLQHAENEWTLITVKNKANFLWCKHSCMQTNVYFLNWKTDCETIPGQDANYRLDFLNFLFSFVLLLSAVETWDTKCLFSWLWVMASARWCCHSDSWDRGTNNNIINSLSGIRRSAGEQRRTEKQRRRQEDSWTHANDGLESFLFLLPSSTLTSLRPPPLRPSLPSI